MHLLHVTVVIVVIAVITLIHIVRHASRSREGYESITNCVDQGYPRSFCLKVPIQSSIGNGYCYCANRQLGTRKSDGECHCFPFNPTFPYYPSKTFRDFPK